jgi:hypothetical protein
MESKHYHDSNKHEHGYKSDSAWMDPSVKGGNGGEKEPWERSEKLGCMHARKARGGMLRFGDHKEAKSDAKKALEDRLKKNRTRAALGQEK